jgi:phospholipid/cholesterol/gamma-HCH transport system ATP-binding protein
MRRFRFGNSKDDQENTARPDFGAQPPPSSPAQGPLSVAAEQQTGFSSMPPEPSASAADGPHSEWLPRPGEQEQQSAAPPPSGEQAPPPAYDQPPPPAAEQPGSGGDQGPIRYERQEPTPSGDQPAPIEAQSGAQDDWFDDEQPETSSTPETPREEEYAPEPVESETREQPGAEEERSSRVSVIDEPAMRPAPPAGASEEEYKWHTYKHYPSGRPDAVEFIDTYKAFGRNHILRGLNMGLPEGMVSMILGPSGTGKSVCIKHMVGLLYPDDGDILVHGQSVPNMPDDDLFEMRKKFGLLFQDGALFGSMNIFDNVAFPLRQHTEKGEDEVTDIVMRRLNEVGLGAASDLLPNELSGGMRKRAGFARALVLEPDIVLFDEPDSGLDPVRTALLGELILEIHRDMMDEAKDKQKEHLPTFAVITHDIMSARRVADYINVLWKGRIVEAGPAEDMLNSDNPFIRQFLAGESQGPLTMD